MKRSRSPIIWREQGGAPRAYGDFRFLGGSREALCLPGTKRGVTDPELAEVLFEKRAAALREARLRGAAGLPQPAALTAFAAEHLMAKAKSGKSTDAWETPEWIAQVVGAILTRGIWTAQNRIIANIFSRQNIQFIFQMGGS